MGSDPKPRRGRRQRCIAAALLASGAIWPVVSAMGAAQEPPPETIRQIYSCIDSHGKKLTSDRPIAECISRDQRMLNSDGSVKTILPPTPTAEERADMEAREREANAERVAKGDAVRRDRNLMARFPNEAAHRRAREKALADIRASVKNSEARVTLLKVERKPLLEEAEFYIGKPMPSKLKFALDANDASLEGQRSLVQNQQAEVVRIDALYDAELARLKKLWAGAPAGSLGPVPGAQASASAATSVKAVLQ